MEYKCTVNIVILTYRKIELITSFIRICYFNNISVKKLELKNKIKLGEYKFS